MNYFRVETPTPQQRTTFPDYLSPTCREFLSSDPSFLSLITMDYQENLWTLLLETCLEDNLDAFQFLLEKDAPITHSEIWTEPPIEIPYQLEMTALSYSCYHGASRIVNFILSNNLVNEPLDPCLWLAIAGSNDEIARILIDHGAALNDEKVNPLLWVVRSNNQKMVQIIVVLTKESDQFNTHLRPSFEEAIALGLEPLVRFFVGLVGHVKLGIGQDQDPWPVLIAAKHKQWKLVRFFMDEFYDPQPKNSYEAMTNSMLSEFSSH